MVLLVNQTSLTKSLLVIIEYYYSYNILYRIFLQYKEIHLFSASFSMIMKERKERKEKRRKEGREERKERKGK